jgi:mono/diheme cytochrome c family protein
MLAPLPSYPVHLPKQVAIPYQDSIALSRGANLVSMNCVVCHRNEEGTLVGQAMPEEGFGEYYVANITNHPEAGIGRYTDPELVYLLRTGLRPDGALLLPVMPQLQGMSDEDLYAIIAYLRSDATRVQGVEKYWPEAKPSFLAKALTRLVFRPAPMPAAAIQAPPIAELEAHGEYLANYVLNCFMCHSASFQTNNDLEPALSEGYYGGGNPVQGFDGQITLSANLTAHPEYGLGQWTLEDFSQALRQGKRPDGRVLKSPMMPYTGLSDEEVAAIWAFLQSVPVQDNDVNSENP